MKLDEVAGSSVKCGLIMPAGGNETLDAGDWHGMTEVYTSKSAFLKAIKDHFIEYLTHGDSAYDPDDEDDMEQKGADAKEIDRIRKATSVNDLVESDEWDSFINAFWIDDRF